MTDALQHLYDRLKNEAYPTAQMGGIYANKPGYHNKRDQLPGSDYSVQHDDDRAGSGQWAAALDITLNPADMRHLTQRLIDLTLARDPRIQVCREFFGTVDGVTVTGMDVREVRWITSDPSHIWHDHISVFRRWAGDIAAMNALGDAILGTTGGDDMPSAKEVADAVWGWEIGSSGAGQPAWAALSDARNNSVQPGKPTGDAVWGWDVYGRAAARRHRPGPRRRRRRPDRRRSLPADAPGTQRVPATTATDARRRPGPGRVRRTSGPRSTWS